MTKKKSYLIVGIHSELKKVSIGNSFREAAEKTNSKLMVQYFDHSLIELHSKDLNRWLDFLPSEL